MRCEPMTLAAFLFLLAAGCGAAQVDQNKEDIVRLRSQADAESKTLREIRQASVENRESLSATAESLEAIGEKLDRLEETIGDRDKALSSLADSQDAKHAEIAASIEKGLEAAAAERQGMDGRLRDLEGSSGTVGSGQAIIDLQVADTRLDQRLARIEEAEKKRGALAPIEHLHPELDDQLVALEKKVRLGGPSGGSGGVERLPGGIPVGTGALLGLLAFLMLIPVVLLVVNSRSNITKRLERQEREMEDLATAQRMATRLAQQAAKPQKSLEEEEAMQESIEAFKIALEDDDHRVNHLFNIGTSFEDLGSFRIAKEWFDSCTKLKPDFTNAWIEKGVCLAMIGNYKEADIALEKALKQNPDHPRAWYNKACILAKLGNDDEMFRSISEAVRLDSDARGRFKEDPDFQKYLQHPEFTRRVG